MSDRKKDHIDLAFSAQLREQLCDTRFTYEPLLGSHPSVELSRIPFLGKELKVPMWVSSMTGGTENARTINANLARACKEFGMGMGLGSCRILMENDKHFSDFDVRDLIGDEMPLFANIGIIQLENMVRDNSWPLLVDLVERLRADGLIIHVNPIQEWVQSEGEVLKIPPIETIERFLSLTGNQMNSDPMQTLYAEDWEGNRMIKVIVKEVGQGMGPESITRLMKLPIEAFELAAFGGTNFAAIELARNSEPNQENFRPFTTIGHTPGEMLEVINNLVRSGEEIKCKQIIISGGIHSFLDGYFYISQSLLPAVFGQASNFLRFARGDYEQLRIFVGEQIKGLKFAQAFLKPKTGT
jgi:isopentenyl-diphosphate delta-isomerase